MGPTPTRPAATRPSAGALVARYVGLFQRTRGWLVAVSLIFVGGIVAGIFGATTMPDQHIRFIQEVTERLQPALEALRSGDNSRAISLIFWNNFRIALLIMGTGALVVFLFMPVISIAANGYLIGVLATIAHQSIDRLLLSIIPHGIFEIPALVIATAWGLKMGLAWLLPQASGRRAAAWRSAVFEAAWIVPLVTILLGVAAVIEVLVTSAIVRTFAGG